MDIPEEYLITVEATTIKEVTLVKKEQVTFIARVSDKVMDGASVPDYFYSDYSKEDNGTVQKGRPSGISNLKHVINTAVKRWYKLAHLTPYRLIGDTKLDIVKIKPNTPDHKKEVIKLSPIVISFYLETF